MMDSEEEEEQTALVCDNGENIMVDIEKVTYILRFRSCQGWLRW